MSRQGHPDAEAIASFRAGLIGGFRGRRLGAHIASCSRCAAVDDQLSAVITVLASVPAPALPDAFERQISAAIAAEATAREDAPRTAGVSPAGAVPADRRPRAARSRHRRAGLRFRPAMALVPVFACLLAGFGYLLSNAGPRPTASTPDNAAAPLPASASAPGLGFEGNLNPSASSHKALSAGGAATFLVITSGTRYEASTLRAQVRSELGSSASATTGLPSAAPTAVGSSPVVANSSSRAVPAKALVGCVLHLTGGATPGLVDRALYQGKPAYVIAVPKQVWVVGLGCTASNPELITSTPLTGAP